MVICVIMYDHAMWHVLYLLFLLIVEERTTNLPLRNVSTWRQGIRLAAIAYNLAKKNGNSCCITYIIAVRVSALMSSLINNIGS